MSARLILRYGPNNKKNTPSFSYIFQSINSIVIRLVSLESMFNSLLEYANISDLSKIDIRYLFCVTIITYDQASHNKEMLTDKSVQYYLRHLYFSSILQ